MLPLRRKEPIPTLLLLLVVLASGIAVGRSPDRATSLPVTLDMNTVRIEGWFSYRGEGGEWMVNSTRGFDTFNPLNKEESQRCISIVNATGADSRDYLGFDDRRVIVTGFTIRYDRIPLGKSYVDRITDHRYYGGQWIQNACLRQWVFVAKRLALKD